MSGPHDSADGWPPSPLDQGPDAIGSVGSLHRADGALSPMQNAWEDADMTKPGDHGPEKVEVSAELKALLVRLRVGEAFSLVENGVVVGELRLSPAIPLDMESVAIAQHDAMEALFAKIDAAAERQPLDGLSGSTDHDRILYGRQP
jgi:hypothetical protein